MLDFVQPINQLGASIFQVIFVRVEERMDDDEAVFGN